MKSKFLFVLPAFALLALASCTTSSSSTKLASNSADAYHRQQSIDYRLAQPLTTDQSSPLKDVRLKPDGVGINTLTF